MYFAMNGRPESATQGAWTAISRVPYLKAINLYAKGDCWHGGGLFLAEREFWLNDGCGHQDLESSSFLQRKMDGAPPEDFGGECLTVYFNRLQRDGWTSGLGGRRQTLRGSVGFRKADRRKGAGGFQRNEIHGHCRSLLAKEPAIHRSPKLGQTLLSRT